MNSLEQIEQLQKHLGLNNQEMAAELGITPEWFSKITNEHSKISANIMLRAGDLARRNRVELDSSVLLEFKNPHLKKGDRAASNIAEDPDNYTTVAPRFPSEPRSPSTLADVQTYFQQLIEAAKASDNPNAWPVIHDRLRKQFPLAEWDQIPE